MRFRFPALDRIAGELAGTVSFVHEVKKGKRKT
jgi:hypothetical protein